MSGEIYGSLDIERNKNKLQKVYELGVKDALEQIEKLKEYLKS